MKYDKALLKNWCNLEDWASYISRNGGFSAYSSKEGFYYLEAKYFEEIQRRIQYCKKLLTKYDDACIYYTLAELYDRCNLDESLEYLFKRPVRYYCLKAIRKNPEYAPVWFLLAESYAWIVTLGGESKKTKPALELSVEDSITVDIPEQDFSAQKRALVLISRAINCIKKAISIEPDNENYRIRGREYYRMKSDIIERLLFFEE